MKRLNGAGTRLLATIREFTVAQRTIAIIGVAVLVLGGIALANAVGKPTMTPLYSNLPASEASAVVAQLQKDKVQYDLTDGGSTILVPAGSVDAERLATATLLSSGAGGYSLLDSMGVTASQFQQDVTFKRAIEGELAKTIESIQGVSAASVQLAIPEQTVFSDEKQSPTASVFVNTASTLTSAQVGAVVHLVSAAYPGLTDTNVSVVDQRGNTLSAVGGGTAGAASDQASDYEARTRDAVQTMLDKVLGPGQAMVTVAADVSRSSGTKRSETYTTPSQAPVLSESTNEQTYNGGAANGGAASGVLGNDTTSIPAGGAAGTGSSGKYVSKQGVKNNGVDKTVTDETIVPGTLNRQTIAVAVNTPAGAIASTAQISQLVSNAAGVNTARGDSVSVNFLPFSNAAAKQAAAALAQSQKDAGAAQTTEIITTAIKVVGGLLLLILLFVLLKKLFKREEPAATAVDGGVLGVVPGGLPGDPALLGAGAPGQLGGWAGMPGAQGLPAGIAPTEVLPTADPAYAQMQADVDALAGGDPAQTAEYLRVLMGERSRA
ncbi:flagellar basal-body MS-ring/collar protein FliF [Amnibacterium endophyticum]|uniref:Flagellar M-ring protein n=1 Tax=Amnibacterium endophyticum TaxID=2109337 RepID=A0ABW4LFC7_9MICO